MMRISKRTKDISLFFHVGDNTENQVWHNLIDLARSKGFIVTISQDKSVEADFGFYSSDLESPGNQRFSIVSINGIDQDHVVRPRHWEFFEKENWHKFDIGLLPGPYWFDGWIRAKERGCAGPKFGVFEVGWSKSDNLFIEGDPVRNKVLQHRVTYAPQTEQDHKQKLVVDAIASGNPNWSLKIKHWELLEEQSKFPWLLTDEYFQNLEAENRYAKDRLKTANVIDPRSNFIDLLPETDLLITDQSSVLYEAMLCGIPTLTVENWRHACGECPGPQPSPDICYVCDDKNLNVMINRIFDNYDYAKSKAIELRSKHFSNLGNASQVILDLVNSIAAKKSRK
jgi:hypothetical protein